MANADDVDDVGYCKPPRRTRFKKGQSGNPQGRPRRVTTLAALIERELNALVTVTEGGRKRRIPARELMVKTLIADAIKRDPKARDIIMRHMRASAPAEPFAFTADDASVIRGALAALVSGEQPKRDSTAEDPDVQV